MAAVIVTLAALLFATLALGPLVRALFGVPAGFNGDVWLVLTSALEWIGVGLLVRSIIRLRSRSG